MTSDLLKNGTITIIESETGSGKTEAAIDYFFQLREKGKVDRLYFALPSRTSAAQIHGRVKDALYRYLGQDSAVVLAVPGYFTSENDSSHHFDEPKNLYDDNTNTVENWFSKTSKRYLSAPVSVGTIDQLLLSILNLKHQTMRWASLGRTLIVVDEVHASDAYMGRLLAEVIERHSNRGGHSLLMSATLGSHMASNLLRAAGRTSVDIEPIQDAVRRPYPAVHHFNGEKYYLNAVESNNTSKNVKAVTMPIINDAESVASIAKRHYLNGAKVLIIRNSVKGCVDVHKILEKDPEVGPAGLMKTGSGVASPHHGRYASADRFILDQAVETSFGKESSNNPVILCATQTVEQSLDIDADIIITDICPIDVLLQRIGRLHRHEGKVKRIRPNDYKEPTVIVLTPDKCVTGYAVKSGNGIGKDQAYADVRIVFLTLELLKENPLIKIPEQNRMLVEKATHPDCIYDLEARFPILEKFGTEIDGRKYADRTIANLNVADRKWEYGDAPQSNGTDVRISSRLGDGDALIKLENPYKSEHDQFITEIKIPYWLIKGCKIIDDVKTHNYSADKSTTFNIDGRAFIYGKYGLEKLANE